VIPRVLIGAAALSVSGSLLAASHRVDVGGHRLNLRCTGQGSPVVVMDSGAGDTLQTWDWVAPDVKAFTRVCVYDRAGLGKSDRGPAPRTSGRIAAELHELLRRAKVPPPYVLVGHSFGGLNMRLFAARNPSEVAGLVLVDATPEDYPDVEGTLHTASEGEKIRTARAVAAPAYNDELDAMKESAAEVRASRPPPGMPVTVLTAAHKDDSPAFRAAWAALQKKMVESFPNARQIAAERSDHYIQFDEPALVTAAIREMVLRARPSATPSPSPPGSSGSP